MKEAKDDGGPAFPTPPASVFMHEDKPVVTHPEYGMSLRDYFAAAALTGLAQSIGEPDRMDLANGIIGGNHYAKAAYRLSDALLKARSEVSS